MSALPTDARGIPLACASCGKTNRLPWSRAGETGRCGACSDTLPVVAAPLEVSVVEAFDALLAQAELPVLVDFWAPWCGPCVMVAPELERVAREEAGRLLVAKVDTDAVPDLAARFRIAAIPTMALFRNGQEVARQAGAMRATDIVRWVQANSA